MYSKTIFCDIDGVIFKHQPPTEIQEGTAELLPGVKDKFLQWSREDNYVVLVTGRPPSLRAVTQKQLINAGLYYHELIMGLPRGARVVINDRKPESDEATAIGISIVRNEGLANV